LMESIDTRWMKMRPMVYRHPISSSKTDEGVATRLFHMTFLKGGDRVWESKSLCGNVTCADRHAEEGD
jgi:hypothetical protein